MAGPSSSSRPPVNEGGPSNRTYALGGLVLGAALGLLAGSQPWWRAEAAGLDASFSGTESTGGISQTLAFVVVAGALLLLTLSVRGRQLIGVLLALVGGSMAVLGVLRVRPSAEAVRDQIRTVSLADQFSLSATAWPWVYAAAGAVVVVAAVNTVLRSDRWPRRTTRFERVTAVSPAGEDPAAAWQAMDAGLDPTADVPAAPARRVDPDVHSGPPQDTMERDSTRSAELSPKSQPSAE
jgi:drug/metabolite transporter (DMT)-like permease